MIVLTYLYQSKQRSNKIINGKQKLRSFSIWKNENIPIDIKQSRLTNLWKHNSNILYPIKIWKILFFYILPNYLLRKMRKEKILSWLC